MVNQFSGVFLNSPMTPCHTGLHLPPIPFPLLPPRHANLSHMYCMATTKHNHEHIRKVLSSLMALGMWEYKAKNRLVLMACLADQCKVYNTDLLNMLSAQGGFLPCIPTYLEPSSWKALTNMVMIVFHCYYTMHLAQACKRYSINRHHQSNIIMIQQTQHVHPSINPSDILTSCPVIK